MSYGYYRTQSHNFGDQLTPVGKKMLIIYGVVYFIELILEHWVRVPFVNYMVLNSIQSDKFFPWQLITHPFLHDPYSPLMFMIDCIVFYFVAGIIENAFGTRRFLYLYFIAAGGGAILALIFSLVPKFDVPFFGMLPSVLALIVIFGFMNPEGTVNLFFVIPIRAVYVSYLIIIGTLLTTLAMANPHGAYHLGGILFGYLYFKGPKNVFDPNLIYLKYLQWKYKRSLRQRFKVHEGGKNDDEGRTLH